MKNHYILFAVIFWIFVIGLFTNFFGFYRFVSKPSVYIDCRKDSSNRYCGDFDEYLNDKMDNAGRTINP